MMVSCETIERVSEPETLVPIVLETTYTKLGNDTLFRCQRLELRDSALCAAMDDIILTDSLLQHVHKGEKTWYEICFNWTQDTMSIDLIASQYYKYSDLYLNKISGILCYKNKIFTVKKTDSLPDDIIAITNDTVSTYRVYEGCTVYFFEREQQSIPENVLIRYKYNGSVFVKQHILLNGININF